MILLKFENHCHLHPLSQHHLTLGNITSMEPVGEGRDFLAPHSFYSFFFFFFFAVFGVRCCAWAFSSCSERGLLFVAVHGRLIAVASLVAEHGL